MLQSKIEALLGVTDNELQTQTHEKHYELSDLTISTQKEVKSLIYNLKQLSSSSIDIQFGSLKEEIQKRMIFVMFEPLLNCDPLTDHKVPKSLLPLYNDMINRAIDDLHNQSDEIVKTQIIQAFGRTYKTEIDSKVKLQLKIDTLEIELRRFQNQAAVQANIIQSLQSSIAGEKQRFIKEIQMMKEQIYQRQRIGNKFEPDFNEIPQVQDALLPQLKPDTDALRSKTTREMKTDATKKDTEIKLLKHQCVVLQKQVQDLEVVKAQKAEIETIYEELRINYEKLEKDTASQINELETEKANFDQKITDIETSKQELEAQIHGFEEKIVSQVARIEELEPMETKFKALSQDAVKTKIKLDKLQKEYDKQKDDQTELQKKNDQLDLQLRVTLQELEEVKKLQNSMEESLISINKENESKSKFQGGDVTNVSDEQIKKKMKDQKRAAVEQTNEFQKQLALLNQVVTTQTMNQPGFVWEVDTADNILDQISKEAETARILKKTLYSYSTEQQQSLQASYKEMINSGLLRSDDTLFNATIQKASTMLVKKRSKPVVEEKVLNELAQAVSHVINVIIDEGGFNINADTAPEMIKPTRQMANAQNQPTEADARTKPNLPKPKKQPSDTPDHPADKPAVDTQKPTDRRAPVVLNTSDSEAEDQQNLMVEIDPNNVMEQHSNEEIDENLGQQIRTVASHLSIVKNDIEDLEDSEIIGQIYDDLKNDVSYAEFSADQQSVLSDKHIDQNVTTMKQNQQKMLGKFVSKIQDGPINMQQFKDIQKQADIMIEAELQSQKSSEPDAAKDVMNKQALIKNVLKAQIIDKLLIEIGQDYYIDKQVQQELTSQFNRIYTENFQIDLLERKQLSEQDTKTVQQILYNPHTVRRIIESIPDLNPSEQQLLCDLYNPIIQAQLQNGQLQQQTINIIVKVFFNQRLLSALTKVPVDLKVYDQNAADIDLIRNEISYMNLDFDPVLFSSNLQQCIFNNRNRIMQGELQGKIRSIVVGTFYDDLLENKNLKALCDQLLRIIKDTQLMQLFLTTQLDKALSKKLFKVYSREFMLQLEGAKAPFDSLFLPADVLIQTEIISLIFENQPLDENLRKLVGQRRTQIKLSTQLQQLEQVLLDPELAKKMASGQMERKAAAAIYKTFYSKEIADAIAGGKFSREAAELISGVLYNPEFANQLRRPETMDPNIAKMFAHTIYSEELLKVVTFPTVGNEVRQNVKDCVEIVKQFAFARPKQKQDPFRVQIVVSSKQARKQHFVAPTGAGNTFVAHIPSNAQQQSEGDKVIVAYEKMPPSVIKTFQIPDKTYQIMQKAKPISYSLQQRKKVNDIRQKATKIGGGVPCCIVRPVVDVDEGSEESKEDSKKK